MASLVFNRCKHELLAGNVSFDPSDNSTIYAMLMTNGFVSSITQAFVSDIVGSEICTPNNRLGDRVGSNTNYNRIPLTGFSLVDNIVLNATIVFSNNLTWAGLVVPASIQGVAVFKAVSDIDDTVCPLLFYFDFSSASPANNEDFVVQWSGSGIISLN